MKYNIVENGVITNIVKASAGYALAKGWTDNNGEAIGWIETEGGFVPPALDTVSAVSALQGLLAIDAAGLSEEYQSWSQSEERTFAERAFINKAMTWRRDDPVLISGATALGLSDEQIDQLFLTAAGR